MAKHQYLILAVPVCLTLVLASGGGNGGRELRQFWTTRTRAAIMVAVLLATMTAAYASWDSASNYATLLQRQQVVDVVFSEIVTAHDDHARADLRALGLPPGWPRYADTTTTSIRNAAAIMTARHLRHLPVAGAGLLGVIDITDVCRALSTLSKADQGPAPDPDSADPR